MAGLTIKNVPQHDWDGVKLTAGTAFPGSPAAGDVGYRTDLRRWGYYDGTRWLGDPQPAAFLPRLLAPIAAGVYTWADGPLSSGYDWYIDEWLVSAYVVGTNNGSNYWTFNLFADGPGGRSSSLKALDTSAGAANTWLRLRAPSGFGTNPVSGYAVVQVDLGINGSPGNLYVTAGVVLRPVLV